MNYTEKYHLPQWKKEDRVMMEDFNLMCANLEEGITKAQGTADTAQKTADAAYTPDKKPYVVGSYVGNGGTMTIELGFRPSFLIISGMAKTASVSGSTLSYYNIFTDGNICTVAVQFTDTGFVATALGSGDYPQTTLKGKTYSYIAFR